MSKDYFIVICRHFGNFQRGFTYGVFLHKKQNNTLIFGAVVLTELFGSLLLNTLWISILYGSPFLPLLVTRVFQVVIMIITEMLVISCIISKLFRVRHAV